MSSTSGEVEILGVGERITAREEEVGLTTTSPDVIEVVEGEGDSEESGGNSSDEGSGNESGSGTSSDEEETEEVEGSGQAEPVEVEVSSRAKKGKAVEETRVRELHYTEIHTNVTGSEAVELRKKYFIPDDYEVRVPKPTSQMNDKRPRTLAIHIPTLRAGFRFPIPDPVLYILQILNLCPTQLLPNSYSLLLSFIVFMRCLGHPASYANFYELFSCQASTKSGELERSGFYFLSARQGRKIFTTPTSSYGKEWKRKWVFIRAPEGGDFDIQKSWQDEKGILPRPVEDTTLVPEEITRILEEDAPQSPFILCQEDVLVAAGLSPAPARREMALGINCCIFDCM